MLRPSSLALFLVFLAARTSGVPVPPLTPRGGLDQTRYTRVGLTGLCAGAFILAMLLLAVASELYAASAKVEIEILDSDALVAPGTEFEVELWVRDAEVGKSYTLRFLHAFGGPVVLDRDSLTGAEFAGPADSDGDLGPIVARLVIPLGTAHREATISAMVDVAGEPEPLPIAITTLAIGDPGEPIGSAVLRPSREEHAKSGKRISTSLQRGKTAYLELTAMNSLGNKTNDYEVSSIIIFAVQADLGRGADTPSDAYRHTLRYGDEPGLTPANAVTQFTLRPVSTDASHIEVYAIVSGEDGHARSNTLELNFAGDPAGLSAGEPSGNLAAVGGTVNIVVTGFDSVGNPTELDHRDIEVEVVEGPDDADFSLIKAERPIRCPEAEPDDDEEIDEEEQQRLAAIRALECNEDQAVVSLTTSREEAALGRYRVEIGLSDIPVPAVTSVEIIVVGHPVFLSLEVYRESDPGAKTTFGQGAKGLLFFVPGQGEGEEMIADVGEVLIAAVVLRDQFGELVASSDPTVAGDGVSFDAAGSLEMLELDSRDQEIVRGVAVARFLVLGESGQGLLIASTAGLHDIVKVVAAAENVRDLTGLTSVGVDDLSVWIAPNQIQASALFPQLASRGATAIHLWLHGQRAWLTFAPADPNNPEPGTDFSIQSGSILWITGHRDHQPPVDAQTNPDKPSRSH